MTVDDAEWLRRLHSKFPSVGIVHTDQWVTVAGWENRWSAPTAYELEDLLRGELRHESIPHLPNILPT